MLGSCGTCKLASGTPDKVNTNIDPNWESGDEPSEIMISCLEWTAANTQTDSGGVFSDGFEYDCEWSGLNFIFASEEQRKEYETATGQPDKVLWEFIFFGDKVELQYAIMRENCPEACLRRALILNETAPGYVFNPSSPLPAKDALPTCLTLPVVVCT